MLLLPGRRRGKSDRGSLFDLFTGTANGSGVREVPGKDRSGSAVRDDPCGMFGSDRGRECSRSKKIKKSWVRLDPKDGWNHGYV